MDDTNALYFLLTSNVLILILILNDNAYRVSLFLYLQLLTGEGKGM